MKSRRGSSGFSSNIVSMGGVLTPNRRHLTQKCLSHFLSVHQYWSTTHIFEMFTFQGPKNTKALIFWKYFFLLITSKVSIFYVNYIFVAKNGIINAYFRPLSSIYRQNFGWICDVIPNFWNSVICFIFSLPESLSITMKYEVRNTKNSE